MKSVLVCLVMAAVVADGGGRPAQDTELLRVRREVWDVWFAGDTARLRALTPGLLTIDSDEHPFSDQEDQIRSSARFHAGGGRLLDLSFPETRIQHFGDVAIIYSTYRLVMVMGSDTNRQNGSASEVFVRQNGRWIHPGWHLDSRAQ